jgi:hypothetical protein
LFLVFHVVLVSKAMINPVYFQRLMSKLATFYNSVAIIDMRGSLMGNSFEDDINYVAEDFEADVLTGFARRAPGRPAGRTDGELLSNRDLLNGLIENSWGEIGLHLPKAKAARDVRNVFQDWARYPDLQDRHVIQVLLSSTDSGGSTPDVPTKRRERSTLLKLLASAQDDLRSCRSRLDAFEQMWKTLPNLPLGDRRWLTAETLDRVEALVKAEEQQNSVQEQLKVAEAQIHDGEVSFAQSEVLRFVDDHRYTLAPLSVANALAGLPMIGYRRSSIRCAKWKRCHGVPYEVFLNIQKLVTSCQTLSDLPRLTERWIRSKRRPKPNLAAVYLTPRVAVRGSAIHELKDQWHDLKVSIETALKLRTDRAELPYRIFAGYVRNKQNQGQLHAFFREEARIP